MLVCGHEVAPADRQRSPGPCAGRILISTLLDRNTRYNDRTAGVCAGRMYDPAGLLIPLYGRCSGFNLVF